MLAKCLESIYAHPCPIPCQKNLYSSMSCHNIPLPFCTLLLVLMSINQLLSFPKTRVTSLQNKGNMNIYNTEYIIYIFISLVYHECNIMQLHQMDVLPFRTETEFLVWSIWNQNIHSVDCTYTGMLIYAYIVERFSG